MRTIVGSATLHMLAVNVCFPRFTKHTCRRAFIRIEREVESFDQWDVDLLASNYGEEVQDDVRVIVGRWRQVRKPGVGELDLALDQCDGDRLIQVEAKIKRTNLTGANLREASLAGAKLYKVKLDGADLSKANLLNATSEGIALENARLCETVLPDGSIANDDC